MFFERMDLAESLRMTFAMHAGDCGGFGVDFRVGMPHCLIMHFSRTKCVCERTFTLYYNVAVAVIWFAFDWMDSGLDANTKK